MKAVNLIPTEQRRATPTGKNSGSAYLVVGVLAVLLVMAVAYVLQSNKVNESKSQAKADNAKAAALEAQAGEQAAFVDFAAIKDVRLATVAGVAETRFDWERLMRELARVMPEGSWIQTADASTTGDEAAVAVDPNAAAVAVQPTATLTGCTPKQSDVATMMVRLRGLYRVTDVVLNESSVETGADSQTTVDNCGSLYRYDLTMSFAPQAPAAEAPTGAMRVPASLGGGS